VAVGGRNAAQRERMASVEHCRQYAWSLFGASFSFKSSKVQGFNFEGRDRCASPTLNLEPLNLEQKFH